MLKTALDLVPILEAIDVVKSSKLLTKTQQHTVLREVAQAVPAPVFCKQCPETLFIINQLLETKDGPQAKRASKEAAAKANSFPQKGATTPPESICTPTSNSRGTGKVSRDAEEPKKQGRETVGRSRRPHKGNHQTNP